MGPRRADPTAIPPRALFDYRRALELPEAEEGFAAVERVPFARRPDPARAGRALVIDADLLPADPEPVARLVARGWPVLVTAWRPAVSTGAASAAEVERELADLRERFGLADAVHCPHGAGPPVCWCRKPLPGLIALLAHRHGLDPARCRLVGRGAADRGVAARLGMRFADVADPAAFEPGPDPDPPGA